MEEDPGSRDFMDSVDALLESACLDPSARNAILSGMSGFKEQGYGVPIPMPNLVVAKDGEADASSGSWRSGRRPRRRGHWHWRRRGWHPVPEPRFGGISRIRPGWRNSVGGPGSGMAAQAVQDLEASGGGEGGMGYGPGGQGLGVGYGTAERLRRW